VVVNIIVTVFFRWDNTVICQKSLKNFCCFQVLFTTLFSNTSYDW